MPVLPENPFSDPSPFADPNPDAPGEFAEIETIRRPFTPTLGDELSVSVGDSVTVLGIFDDGWAYVEKLRKDKESRVSDQSQSGLIPIDCLRDAGLDVPEFLAAKRVSSFAVNSTGYAGVAI